jgi:hypothetical protein
MDDISIRPITAWAGIAAGITVFAAIPLYFVYDGPPPADNVFTRCLITLFMVAFLLVFFSGFTHLIRRQGAAHEWHASLFWGTSLLYAGFVLLGAAHEAGVAFNAPGVLDPTIDGPLADANILVHGSIKRMLTAVMLFVAGSAVLRTRMIPRWLGFAAWAIALVNLAFVPSIYFGKDPTAFYSAIGWGNTALVGSLIIYWIIAVAIALLRRPNAGSFAT